MTLNKLLRLFAVIFISNLGTEWKLNLCTNVVVENVFLQILRSINIEDRIDICWDTD